MTISVDLSRHLADWCRHAPGFNYRHRRDFDGFCGMRTRLYIGCTMHVEPAPCCNEWWSDRGEVNSIDLQITLHTYSRIIMPPAVIPHYIPGFNVHGMQCQLRAGPSGKLPGKPNQQVNRNSACACVLSCTDVRNLRMPCWRFSVSGKYNVSLGPTETARWLHITRKANECRVRKDGIQFRQCNCKSCSNFPLHPMGVKAKRKGTAKDGNCRSFIP